MRTIATPEAPGGVPVPPPVRVSTFEALRHRNFRLWFFGQMVSLVGSWMQVIAQNWLVYQLTGSAWDLGLVNFVGAIPLVPLTLHAGAIADRFSKRRTIFLAQSAMMLLAFTLALLCFTGAVRLWHVLLLAFLLGAAQAVDTPARQAFVVELVGKEHLSNAIALNSGTFHAARVVGPAAAGLLVAWAGIPWAFLLNGISFLAVLWVLLRMDRSRILRTENDGRDGNDLWGGIRHILSHRPEGGIVLLISLSALLAMPYHVLVPIYAKEILGGSAGAYGVLMTAAGVGAVLGSLVAASGRATRRPGTLLLAGSLGFPLILIAFSVSRNYPLSIGLLGTAGFLFVLQNAPANSRLQTLAPDRLRGRVMAIYVSLFLGMMRLGSLLLGWLASATSAPAALAAAGAAGLAAGLTVHRIFPEIRRSGRPDPSSSPGERGTLP
ncbi:MAG: MFS transporter [Deltaproteobacteria bacterium]